MRYARKTDGTQAEIVRTLMAAGIRTWVIGEPCDLLCNFWCRTHQRWCWQTLECKPLTGKRAPKARIRSDQQRQNAFLAATGTPVVTSGTEALKALYEHA
jgi:hypothetical protein